MLVRVCGVVSTVIEPSSRVIETFEDFYRREFAPIAVVAGAVVTDRQHGEDIAQEAMSRAARQWETVGRYDKPGAWVRRVALNLAFSARRRRRSETTALDRVRRERVAAVAPRAGSPEVWAAVDELPPRQRAAVILFYVEDLPVSEIADILDVSRSTATSHLDKARRSLRRRLESDGKQR